MSYGNSSPLLYIVYTTLIGVVTAPAIVLFVLLIRRSSGDRREPSRRWVTFTKAGFGLFSLIYILTLVNMSFYLGRQGYYGWHQHYDEAIARSVLNHINALAGYGEQIVIFFAIFYLARAFTLLRTDETSRRYRIGRKCALGAAIFICMAGLTSTGLSISVTVSSYSNYSYGYGSGSYNNLMNRQMASFILYFICTVTNLVCSIGAMVYAAKARKKVLGGPLHKASNLLLTCAILWLVRNVWSVFYAIVTGFFAGLMYEFHYWGLLVDAILYTWTDFVVLVLLYVLATKGTYNLSKGQQHETRKEDEEVF